MALWLVLALNWAALGQRWTDMEYLLNIKSHRRVLSGFVIAAFALMLGAVACSGQAVPTSQPSPAPIDQAELRSLVEDAVKAALAEAIPPPQEEISRQELRDMMEEAVAEAAPAAPATNQNDVAELVAKSVAETVAETLAARPAAVTKDEMEQLFRAEIELLRESLAAITAPTPAVDLGKPTIVFSDLRRQSARIQNRIAMYIVENGYGYPVDKISGETLDLWDDLLDGDSLVTMEIVLPNQQEAWDAAIIDGAVIPLGESSDENWQGFVVPSYVAKDRPLLHLQDIAEEDYIDLFVDPDKRFEPEKKAVLVTCPIGTECHEINQAKMKAYKLEDDVELVVPASLFALEDSLERAYAEGRPWLGYMYGPSRLSEELELTVLREPEYTDECWATTKGCAYPTARILIAVHPSMVTIAPDVVEFLLKWDFTARRLILSQKWMGDNNANEEQTAVFFLKTWPADWVRWVPEDVAQRVQSALADEMGPAG